jgi:LysM repeat protein
MAIFVEITLNKSYDFYTKFVINIVMQLKLKLILLFCFLGSFAFASVDDSTGVILRNGQVYILHKVDKGQSLYGAAQRYKVQWTDIRDANPGSEIKINIGQILRIPTGKTEKQFFGNKTPKYSKNANEYSKPTTKVKDKDEKAIVTISVDNSESNATFTIPYTVKKGETLFSIAQKFNTSVDFLKQLNKLKSEAVEVEKKILVPVNGSAESDSLARQREEELANQREKVKTDSINLINSKINSEEIEKKIEEEKNTPSIPGYTIVTENFPEFDVEKITETGCGKLMADTKINQTKNWITHHSAPAGTVILITNPANNKTVYAKVVKNFYRAENDAVIVYLTKTTVENLGFDKKEKFTLKLSFAK